MTDMPAEKVVHLTMALSGEFSDEEVVLRFVETLVAKGLRSWMYHVTDAATGETSGFYDGYGQRVTVSATVTEEEREQEHPIPRPTDEDNGESDEELLQLSRDLNAADNEPPTP